MDIPHPNIALSAIDVPLDPDGANGSRNSGDDHVADLGLASVTGIAHLTGTVRVVIKSYRTCIYLEDGNGIVDVCEFGSRSKDGGPEFSRDNRASGDVDCVLDDVGASIEIWEGFVNQWPRKVHKAGTLTNDLTSRILVKYSLNRSGIIRGTVSLCTVRLDRDEF
jgi:hypothetical protein